MSGVFTEPEGRRRSQVVNWSIHGTRRETKESSSELEYSRNPKGDEGVK